MKTKPLFTKVVTPLAGSICALLTIASLLPLSPLAWGAEAKRRSASAVKPGKPADQSEAVANPRSPEEAMRTGLDYLLKQQQSDGGWSQGGGWRQNLQKGGRVEDVKSDEPSDLGNTCVSLVALVRAGHTPKAGEHRTAAAKAAEFICRQVEAADSDSLYVTPVRDTQLQVKIGSYVDTFLTGWALSELKDRMPDEAAENRRAAALDKVVRKIERNQGNDGSFAGNKGWAAVLSQGLASKALNGAARSGAKVSQSALDKDLRQNSAGVDVTTGSISAPAATEPSSAGISLYRETAKVGGLWERARSNVSRKAVAEKTLADTAAPAPVKQKAEQELKEIAADEQTARAAAGTIAKKTGDARFTAGFGNNGGEEFLSFMNLTESMHAQGGEAWTNWRAQMVKTVTSAQNADGSWAGHHCITGRTFCTGTALLTLLVEKGGGSMRTSSVETNTTKTAATK